jgi:hypothetical protein
MRPSSRTLLALVAVAVLALSLHTAFAASNAVPTSRAGLGQRAVSGFNVTAITWTLDAADPSRAAAVRFRVTPAPAQVYAQFPLSSLTWRTCTLVGANATCALAPTLPVAAVTSLRVAAAR